LNYGHTLGHALERLDAFAGRSHGEAVAIGMVFAARLAASRGLAAEELTQRTVRVLTSLGLETDGPLPSSHDILAAFRMDKKFHGGVRFVLLRAVGDPTVVEGVTDDELRTVLNEMGAPA
jgi:3-dehydroquinate synthase